MAQPQPPTLQQQQQPRFIVRGDERRNIWRQMGTDTKEQDDLPAAAREAHLDELVIEKWMHVAYPASVIDGRITPFHAERPPIIPPYASLVRRPLPSMGKAYADFRHFGVVSADYPLVQVSDLENLLSGLTKPPISWKLSTCGLLKAGEITFFCFETGRTHIGRPGKHGGEMVQYFVVANFNDGGHAVQLLYGPVRVVCENTLMLSLQLANVKVRLPHLAGIHADMALWVEIMTGLKVTQAKTNEAFEALYAYRATEEQVEQVLTAAFPRKTLSAQFASLSSLGQLGGTDEEAIAEMQGRVSDAQTRERVQTLLRRKEAAEQEVVAHNLRMAQFRTFARDIIEQERSADPEAGLLWNAVNAVAETAQFQVGPRQSAFTLAQSAAFGDNARLLNKAGDKALELVSAGRH